MTVEEVFSRAAVTTSIQSGIQITRLKKTQQISASSHLEEVGYLSQICYIMFLARSLLCVCVEKEKRIIIILKLFLSSEQLRLSPHLCFPDIYPAVHACTTNRNKI